jgi:hypothetical protein
LGIGPVVEKFEVVQVLEQPDEVYNLAAGPYWFSQRERADGRQEVFKVPSNLRHEARDVQVFNPELLDIGQREEVAYGKAVEIFWGKSNEVIEVSSVDLELLDQGKQTQSVHDSERSGPYGFLVQARGIGSSDKGVMEMGNGDDVPGVTGQGACAETAPVVDKMLDDHFDDLLGKLGDGGRGCCRGLRRSAP